MQRSTAVNAILNVAFEIFGEGDDAAYARPYKRNEDVRFASLLRFPNDTNAKKLNLTMPWMYKDRANKPAGFLDTVIIAKVCLLVQSAAHSKVM